MIDRTPEAYAYPLLIKQLLHTPRATALKQEVVYADKRRLSYGELFERIGRLGNALRAQGAGLGRTVGVMDWDSHRYLECFFAVPMLGSVLMTVNVRLAPEQYLWVHRRWKSRPSWERKGQPMPDRVRRKLLELPWLDEAQVDAIAAATIPEHERLA